MKIRWTLSLAAVALVVGTFPAFASQGAPSARQSTGRKLDAAARTPYVTKHQVANLKKAVGAAQNRVADEQLADPSQNPAGQPNPAPSVGPDGQPLATAQIPTQPAPEAPKPEPEKPKYRFMGTACGHGDDVAMFDTGGATPVFRRVGDRLEDGAEIVGIERGCVRLVQTVPPAKKGEKESKNRFDLYNW